MQSKSKTFNQLNFNKMVLFISKSPLNKRNTSTTGKSLRSTLNFTSCMLVLRREKLILSEPIKQQDSVTFQINIKYTKPLIPLIKYTNQKIHTINLSWNQTFSNSNEKGKGANK
jgi:hypothetical protein